VQVFAGSAGRQGLEQGGVGVQGRAEKLCTPWLRTGLRCDGGIVPEEAGDKVGTKRSQLPGEGDIGKGFEEVQEGDEAEASHAESQKELMASHLHPVEKPRKRKSHSIATEVQNIYHW